MSVENDLMTQFHQLMETGQSVELVNIYRGIPVSSQASIQSVDQGYVTLQVGDLQAISMFLEGKTYLHSPDLPEFYRATVIEVDVPKKLAVLSEFTTAGDSVEKRASIRVQPDEFIDVAIDFEGHHTTGKLADISINGLGVFSFDTYVYSDPLLSSTDDAAITLKLPTSDRPIQFQGKIVHITYRGDPRLRRVGLKITEEGFSHEPDEEASLMQYISLRQQQFIQELKSIYDTMLIMRKDAPHTPPSPPIKTFE